MLGTITEGTVKLQSLFCVCFRLFLRYLRVRKNEEERPVNTYGGGSPQALNFLSILLKNN